VAVPRETVHRGPAYRVLLVTGQTKKIGTAMAAVMKVSLRGESVPTRWPIQLHILRPLVKPD
jgi:hypothetical protein